MGERHKTRSYKARATVSWGLGRGDTNESLQLHPFVSVL